MKDIKGKVLELHSELTSARHLVKDIIGTLKCCDDGTILTQAVGIYARQMPKFKILAEQRVHSLSIVRQVCTGEIEIEKAIELFKTAEKQLDDALACFNL